MFDIQIFPLVEFDKTDVKNTCVLTVRHKSESCRQELTGSGVFTLTSKKAEPKVGHL